MPEETLFTAARRVVRDMDIDLNKGGLVTEHTQKSLATLNKMVLLEAKKADQSNVVTLPQDQLYQTRIQQWILECFGEEMLANIQERCQRFIEEALELVQSCDFSKEDAHMIVDYVYGRPVGEPGQEIGGTMVTLAGLCAAIKRDILVEAEREYARIVQPEIMQKIREKQATKPKGSPLPGKAPE